MSISLSSEKYVLSVWKSYSIFGFEVKKIFSKLFYKFFYDEKFSLKIIIFYKIFLFVILII